MPKIPQGAVLAMDKSTGLYEVIKPSKANRAKFKKRSELAFYHQEERETLSLLSYRISVLPEPIHIPPPIPNTLKFRKTKLLCRIEELKPNLLATTIRLQPIVAKLSAEAEQQRLGLPISISPEIGIRLWDWYQKLDELDELEEKLDTIGHTLTNAQWRRLSGSLKQIGGVSFVNLSERFSEVCKELYDLNIKLP
ncbi:hypothetical protein BT96DRAFT_1000873 [Gymnopus androsaceus JB14]|uniref:Uncharacterized protein n=1 Tax=Gymnopus androsaceus JB14 TaxID=1447944 RepID=A0A6A4H299_9AGAR|nr:hypothetical protein BT96DRAFT_1000873 [Gymnopus androsaceus JB14]